MDVSKLPKLSDSRAAAGEADGETPSPVTTSVSSAADSVGYRGPQTPMPPGVGVDVWISTVLGVLFVFLGLTFGKFALAKLTHQPFHTGINWTDDNPKAGQEVSYFELEGYTAWTEMGVFLFGLTLLFEAASKAAIALRPGRASRAVLGLALLLTLATVGLNLYACGLLMHVGITPILSGLAVAFGGWILYDEWQTLRRTSPLPVAGRA